ncbi:uncharacterized protein HD556DRAFT_271347 [Suillus plorans]|uniref:Secreted protein n=1 Tax=Suillus plorans TaxID=116603 RepID=A0A9P7DKK5_9AGAM|nr:uncharacterized protein HD556DRAFT_271347 [Suillus plorans]KAG1797074.1 hypothetical protein HD556DRAFT_271347 [Suillus plorans]
MIFATQAFCAWLCISLLLSSSEETSRTHLEIILASPVSHFISRVLGLSVVRRTKINFVAVICLHFLELCALFLAKFVRTSQSILGAVLWAQIGQWGKCATSAWQWQFRSVGTKRWDTEYLANINIL